MNRIIIAALLLSGITANAQVGINTDNPKATLHVESKDPAHKTEGIMFPKATQDEMTSWGLGTADAGIMVYNTSQNCLELWNGVKWVNQCGGRQQVPSGPPTPPGPILPAPAPAPTLPSLPGGMVLGDSGYYIASIYDENYLPYTANTGAAQLGASNPDGHDVSSTSNPFPSENTVINVQGVLDNTGIVVGLPIKQYTGTTVTVPAFSVFTKVPARLTQNNSETEIELHIPAQTFYFHEQNHIRAILRAKESDPAKWLYVKKLDMNVGNGADYRGIPLAEFKYFSNSSKSDVKTFYFNAVTGIPDLNFDVPQDANSGGFSGQYLHRFIYVPAYGMDGKVWLSNNLGANYANLDNFANFNPGKQAESPTDHNAYGSLFQWGRIDAQHKGVLGHELIERVSSTIAGVKIGGPFNWGTDLSSQMGGTHIEYCPVGFATPTKDEWLTYIRALASNNAVITVGKQMFNDPTLRLSFGGRRHYMSGIFQDVGTRGLYWSRTNRSSTTKDDMPFEPTGGWISWDYASQAQSVRCIKQ